MGQTWQAKPPHSGQERSTGTTGTNAGDVGKEWLGQAAMTKQNAGVSKAGGRAEANKKKSPSKIPCQENPEVFNCYVTW